MKKIIFQLGDISQLAYALQPVAQQQISINQPIINDPMSIPDRPIRPTDIVDFDWKDKNTWKLTELEQSIVESKLKFIPNNIDKDAFENAWAEI